MDHLSADQQGLLLSAIQGIHLNLFMICILLAIQTGLYAWERVMPK